MSIYAPKEGYISFFNSPYYAHRQNLAIDIYPPRKELLIAHSPVEGKIKKIYNFTPPNSKCFKGNPVEQLIVLESNISATLHLRLLHIDSTVKVGEHVSIGDVLGTMVRSGFFNFWTNPHIHVEVRKKGNLLRAKGSEPIIPCIKGKENKDKDARRHTVAPLHVLSVEENYVLVKTGEDARIGGVYGVGCTLGRDLGILDGGMPHYSFGGAYLGATHSVNVGDSVKRGSCQLGKVVRVLDRFAIFKRTSVEAYVNDTRIRGFAVFLHFKARSVMKLIPMIPNELQLVPGEHIQLTFA